MNIHRSECLLSCMLAILTIVVDCGQFHILSQVNKGIYDNNVTSIATLSDQRLAVISDYYGRDWDVSIYQGPKYTSNNNYFTIPKTNKVVVTNDEIIVGDASSLSTKQNKKIRQYLTTGISGSKLAVTKNYVLQSQSQACPNLYYVDYNNWKNGSVFYEQGADCKFGFMGFVWNLNNGYVAYVAKFNLYIVEEPTLNLYQKIVDTGPFRYNGFIYSSAASAGQDSTVLVEGDRHYYKTFSRNPLTQQFQKNTQFHNPTDEIKLTGIDTGVSFQFTSIYYWRNIKKHVVSLDWSNKQLFFEYKSVIAQYDDKDMVVLCGSKNLSFYKYNQNNYNLELMYEIPLEFYAYQQHEGAFTSNGETMIARIQMAGSQWIMRVDVNTKSITYAQTNESKTANCTAHALINDNYVVTLCGVYVNYTVYQYQLQLRTVSGLAIVDTVLLPYVKNLPEIRIIGSPAWDDYFAVLVRDTDGYFGDNSTTYIYRASGGIVNTSVTSNKLSYYRSIPWGKYIGSLKFYASNQPIPEQSYLRIFKVSDLSLAYQTYNEQGIADKRATVYVQKNLLVIQSYPLISGGLGYVYDINQPFQSFYRGAYFRLHSEYSDWIILPKHNLLYFYSMRSGEPYKAVYDILTPPIYKIGSIFDQYVAIKSPLYLTMNQFIPTAVEKCPLVFFVINTTLYKYRDCENAQPAEKFSLDPTGTLETLVDPRLWMADDKMHLMIGSGVNNSIYTVQIRSLYDPRLQLWANDQKIDNVFNANLLPSGLIIYSTFFYIKFTNFYPIIEPSGNDMDKFIDYDSNSYGCITFSGKNKTAPNETLIVYSPNRKLIPKYTIAVDSNNVTMLTLHPECKYLVAYIDSIMVTAYKITAEGPKNVSYWLIEGVKSFKLMGTKLIIQTQHQVYVKNIEVKEGEDSTDVEQEQVELFESGNYAVSPDGVYYAEGNDSSVRIKKFDTMASVDEFTIQKGSDNPVVTALTFSPSNELFIATNTSNLLILTPVPCPNNLILEDFLCVCSPTFIRKDDTCICEREKYNNKDKNQCSACEEGKYITATQDQCLECSFTCSSCVDQASNCLSYSIGFILLIVGICVVAVALIGVAAFCIIKKRKQARADQVDTGSGLLTQDKNNSEYD